MYNLLKKVAHDREMIGFTAQKGLFRLSGLFLWEPAALPTRLYTLLTFLFGNSVAALTFLQVFKFNIKTLADFTEMVFTLIVAMLLAHSLLKLTLLHSRNKYIKELIDFLESLPKLDDSERVKRAETVCMSYMLMLLFTAVPKYCVAAMKGELPFKTAWPFDTDTNIGWWIAYSSGLIVSNLSWFCQSATDTLFLMSATVILGHLTRLRLLLSSVGKNPKADRHIINTAVNLHVDLLYGAELMNRSFNVVVMVQSLYTIVHSVIILFYLVKVSEVINAVALSIMLVASYAQLLVYCSSGQALTNEFERVHTAAFDNYWYRSSPSVRKSLLLIGLRSQRPVMITNFSVFKALHVTFLHSCQESFSYYVVFKTLAANIELS